ncbi:putative alpha/beta superfamily hydrolase [Neorhizobium huautlense]|uniref:Alpha/beta superfamily hydrolase n=1 Tax=Neorhizobium huautlense TaxID=67774 RepID=A0ABT9Q3Z0_9HYPH|nr:alpha/beta hydrolase-fold protein [Neorhizobium huautlense]MDP9840684.1 putative alpha/beta superfamily hydrolase [Neorhizobium huautlense]
MTEDIDVSNGFRLTNTISFDLRPARGGEPYRIFIAPPSGDMPASGWPILYLLDGNACFPLAVAAHRIQAPYPGGTNIAQGIIVGIGYPTEDLFHPLRRSWDLSPPPGRTYPPFETGGPPVRTGGAEEFLEFIETELKPHITKVFPVDADRQSLFGHSFGGLFALYTLFSRARSFSRYIAASPSIFWEGCRVLDLENQFLANVPTGKEVKLHLCAGEHEGEELAPFQIDAEDASARLKQKKEARTLVHVNGLAARLSIAAPPGMHVEHEIFTGENHMSALPIAIARAIRLCFEWRSSGLCLRKRHGHIGCEFVASP